jgi:hypothetical protein
MGLIMDELVTIASFDFPTEAEIQRVLLEQEGIRAFLADANLVGTDWFYATAVRGVKLQVAASDAQRASEILEQHRTHKAETQEARSVEAVAFACQECGKSITFPGDRRGHVEVCPRCGEYVDVPDGDNDAASDDELPDSER